MVNVGGSCGRAANFFMQRSVDYIIVGFGLAGAILAFKCWKKNKSFVIYDNPHSSSASSISSGLINPITGRRFVKSWQYDELVTTLIETYSQIEQEFKIKLLSEITIQRSLFTIKDENLWTTISQNEPQYCLFNDDDSPWDAIVKHSHSKGIICLLYTSPSPRDATLSRMPSSA